jgi:osmotically inducible protein OsmC
LGLRITRTAQASWQGTVPHGGGRIAVGSGAFDSPFTLKGRVDEVPGTNPEELIGAAQAGCFTMGLANLLEEAGHPPAELRTTAKVRLEQQARGFSITRIELDTTGDVPGVDADRFATLAQEAKAACPVSRALAGTEIVLTARLREHESATPAGGARE